MRIVAGTRGLWRSTATIIGTVRQIPIMCGALGLDNGLTGEYPLLWFFRNNKEYKKILKRNRMRKFEVSMLLN